MKDKQLHLIYPKKWTNLEFVPNSRSELIHTIMDVVKWDDMDGNIKRSGADTILDFLFDVYEMHVDCEHLVGKLIFRSELQALESFIQAFNGFVQGARMKDSGLDNLHKQQLPKSTKDAAERLYHVLARSGLPSTTI